MPEANSTPKKRVRRVHHTGRGSQVGIYLGKQLRFFINESDWKVLPMAAIIAGLVAMVIRKRFFVNMEGALIGGFALTCVAIWNGCFNSIQAVCRERAIIKREHRSGMHISAYMTAHMIYQFFLCAAQTVLTMFVLRQLSVPIPRGFGSGTITPWMICDLGITMFLISYAADMLSLFLSSISRTTTGAMTLMPFILIFQLVFSGGVIPLPQWSRPLSNFTISNYGIKAMTAEGMYNELPMTTVWTTVSGMRDTEIGGTFTVGEMMDKLDNPVVDRIRDREILKSYTVGEIAEILSSADEYLQLREKAITHPVSLREILNMILEKDVFAKIREKEIFGKKVGDLLASFVGDPSAKEVLDLEIGRTITIGEVLDALHAEDIVKATADVQLNEPVTVGSVVDFLKTNQALQEQRDRTITLKTTVGEVMDLFGEENVRNFVQDKTAAAARQPEYERTEKNIVRNWLMLVLFIFVFALLATVVLEMIDKDKR